MKTLLNRVLVTLLVMSLLLSAAPQLFGTLARATADSVVAGSNEVFKDMKIGVMSDLHFQVAQGTAEKTVPAMLERFKADKVDVVMITGDIGYACEEVEYEKFWTAWNSVFPEKETAPELLVISGNHEFDRAVFKKETYEDAISRFLRVFKLDELNQHKVVNGYHFIGINSENESTHGLYTEATTTWLKQQLDAAVAENPNNPIFVTAHQTMPNTTYGSDWASFKNSNSGSGTTAPLYEVLKDYPQVVYFAGHSHYASENERSIHQEHFTSVDVTSMNYMSLEDGNYGYQSQGALLVTIKGADKQLVIDRYKINNDASGNLVVDNPIVKVKQSWTLNLPLKQSEFTYTNARAEGRTAPTFAAGSALTISDVTFASAKIAFPTATHDDYVHNYNIRVKQGDTVVVEKLINGDFYQLAESQKATWATVVEGLAPDTKYTVEVTAEESFGKESQPLVAEFTTQPPLDKTQFNDPMDNWDLIADKHEKWQKEKNATLGKTLFSKTDNSQDVWMVWKFDGYIRNFNLDLVVANGFGGTINEMEIYVSKDGADWKQLCLKATDLVADPVYANPADAYWMNSTVSNTNAIGGTYTYLKVVLKPFSAGVNWVMLMDNLYVKLSEDANDTITKPGTFVHEEDPSLTWQDFIDPMDNWDLLDPAGTPNGWQKENNKQIGKTIFTRTENGQDVSLVWKVDGYIREFDLDILSVRGFGDPTNELEIYVSKDGQEWVRVRLAMTDLVADPSEANPEEPYWLNATVSNNKRIGGDYSYLKVVFKPFASNVNWSLALDTLNIQSSSVAEDVSILPGTFYGEEDPSKAWQNTTDPMDNFDLIEEKSDGWQLENNKEVNKTLFSRGDNSQDIDVTWKVNGYIRNFALDILSVNGGGNPAEEVEILISKDGVEWKALKMVIGEMVPDPGTAYWNDTTITPTNIIGEDYSYIRIVFKPFAFAGWAVVLDNLTITYSEYADDAQMQKGTFVVEEEHVCQFAEEWTHDETSHWHECACGAKADEAACVFGEEWKSNGTHHWHECVCGNKIENAEHVKQDLDAVDATCTEPGLSKGAKCSICERTMIKQTELPANGHSYGEWTVTKEATVEAEGEEKRVCSACGEEETRSIAKLEPQPTEPKPTEPKPTEPKPTEPKPTEPKPTEPAGPSTGLIIGIVAAVVVACAVVAFVLIKKRKG